MTINSYGRSTLETPAFHVTFAPLLPVMRPILGGLFCVRSRMSQPLQIRVLPKFIPLVPGLSSLCFVTYGQVLLALPLLLLVLAGYTKSFLDPDLDQSGSIAGLALMAAFLTANKSNSVLSFVLGIPFERLIPYHNLASLAAILLSAFHTYVAFVYGDSSGDGKGSRERRLSEDSAYALFGPNPDFVKFLFDGGTNFSGTMIIVFMLVLVGTSFFSVFRRCFFEFWLFTHVASAIGVVAFCLAHSVGTVFIVGLWWAADVFFRYVIMSLCVYPKKATLELVLEDVVEVRFKASGFKYNAGQFVQVCFPSIATFQFHPVTISSAPHEPYVTLHIRALGGWSKKLASLAATCHETTMMLEGPYGSLAMDLNNDKRYQMVLCVGGGIGVTPCQSLARHILHGYHKGRTLQKLQFVWAVQSLEMALAIPPPPVIDCATVVGDSEVFTNAEENSEVLSTHVYVTKPEAFHDETLAGCHTPFTLFEGRPDFDSIFRGLRREAKENGLTNVAVIVCGPKKMTHKLRACCREYSDLEVTCNGVKFDLHEELFDF
ncbi:generating NADPH oxidase heavy chain subunit [Seminavis robusta]|uniref:Generating NADPH oxidase heavy chain subunit n=1 Tax=Seminavis robusta TaxID=568900 RepID=A0A9N8ECW1_9STRA|nr:generating NADPH oxidase heavy chain subunit [Seminavis robusta]|eukprot:Sro816_g206660.1 generating NADPH oxidase heavy chain subunit (546) ;mRNA; r:16034-17745